MSNSELPEYVHNTKSPLSPQPLHSVLEPSKISVLHGQTNPSFGDMTPIIDSHPHELGGYLGASSLSQNAWDKQTHPPAAVGADNNDDSASASSFSSAYRHDPQQTNELVQQQHLQDEEQVTTDDDYDMAVDSEEEGQSMGCTVSQRKLEQEFNSLPADMSKMPTSADMQTHLPSTDSAVQPPPPLLPATQAEPHTYDQITSGEVDIQALLDNITANAEKHENNEHGEKDENSTPLPSNPPSLPPKPNISLSQNTWGNHSSLSQTAGDKQTQSLVASLPPYSSLPPRPPTSSHDTYRPPPGVNVPYVAAAGAPGTSTSRLGGLPPPPGIYPPPPGISHHENRRPSSSSSADAKWSYSVQQKYDKFLQEERKYISDQLWDTFPPGSRLFIGNLFGESVTKRDIFHVFHRHGRIAQIAVKATYGFVQFHDSESCLDAVRGEQGVVVRNKPMQLAVSKDTKSKNKAAASRRSRSPESRKGADRERNGRRSRDGPILDEYGRPLNQSHLRYRSPSPSRNCHFRSRRDSYSSRGRGDFYDGQARRRGRSRSPFHDQSYGYRNRSPIPQREDSYQSELARREDDPIRRRDPADVPDIQIYLTCTLDRAYISWIEKELRSRGLKTDVMMYNHRLPEDYLIRRQILDGVHAVSKLGMDSQNKSKMSVKIFERRIGSEEVTFNDYVDLDPNVVAELVSLTKERFEDVKATKRLADLYSSAQPEPQPRYESQPVQIYPTQPNYQQSYQQQTQYQPDLSMLVTQLDNSSLQKLLGSLTTQQAPQQNTAAANNSTSLDLASILGGLQPQQGQNPPQPAVAPYVSAPPAAQQYNQYAPQPSTTVSPNQEQEAVQQVQNIIAQLARFRK
ncbi:hypothetical protein BJ878DRAFT_492534 [Calycina marina]|uniref:RRM domain-containing protein n=1 Tax=Calycina marina TaxID=1763456 RepID=A0A9P7Z998_9HELO|nr:hypothetical protein BJ878DRAFT_492534 [Calycina marina]